MPHVVSAEGLDYFKEISDYFPIVTTLKICRLGNVQLSDSEKKKKKKKALCFVNLLFHSLIVWKSFTSFIWRNFVHLEKVIDCFKSTIGKAFFHVGFCCCSSFSWCWIKKKRVLSLREIELSWNYSILEYGELNNLTTSIAHPDCIVHTLDLNHFTIEKGVHLIAKILLSSNVECLILSNVSIVFNWKDRILDENIEIGEIVGLEDWQLHFQSQN